MSKILSSGIVLAGLALILLSGGCAKQSTSILGGPVDTDPPKILKASPANFSTDFKSDRVDIYFDEYVKLKDLNKQFFVSPPMEKKPEVLLYGKYIRVNFDAPLKDGYTYSLNFGKSIVDNNEDNPMGFFEYAFSTGSHIDSLSLTGRVLRADNLSAGDEKDQTQTFTKVMLYASLQDSVPYLQTPDYLAVADMQGFFRFSHIRPGTYRLFALKDIGDNLLFDLPNESIAFLDSTVVLDQRYYHRPDSLFDLIHDDSVKINTPGLIDLDVELFLFEEPKTRQYLVNSERTEAHKLLMQFNLPLSQEVQLKPVEDDTVSAGSKSERDWAYSYLTAGRDSLMIWIRDTSLISRNPLILSAAYPATDSLGNLYTHRDTLRFSYVPKSPTSSSGSGARRRGEAQPVRKVLQPFQLMQMAQGSRQSLVDLHVPYSLTGSQPMSSFDPVKVHLYQMRDSIPTPVDFVMERDTTHVSRVLMKWNIKEDTQYRIVLDSMAFSSIYGVYNDTSKLEFRTQRSDYYSTIRVSLSNVRNQVLVQALDEKGGTVVKQVIAQRNGVVQLNFLPPGTYRIKMIQDGNRNGRWDTGHYLSRTQPERVELYPEPVVTQSSFTTPISIRLRD